MQNFTTHEYEKQTSQERIFVYFDDRKIKAQLTQTTWTNYYRGRVFDAILYVFQTKNTRQIKQPMYELLLTDYVICGSRSLYHPVYPQCFHLANKYSVCEATHAKRGLLISFKKHHSINYTYNCFYYLLVNLCLTCFSATLLEVF